MKARERRYRILSVPEYQILDAWLQGRRFVIKPTAGLPEDAVVESVHHDWQSKAFKFTISHPSFDVVPEGQAPNPIWLLYEVVDLVPDVAVSTPPPSAGGPAGEPTHREPSPTYYLRRWE